MPFTGLFELVLFAASVFLLAFFIACTGSGEGLFPLTSFGDSFFGIGENPDVLSKLGAPSGTRPLACAFASSIANFFFSTLLSRSDKSTFFRV